MNDLERALDHISVIHDHLARTEAPRNLRSLPVAFSGALALAAAAIEPWVQGVSRPDGPTFVRYWVVVAVLAATIGGAGVARRYLRGSSDADRRRTRLIAGQFAPVLVAGTLLSWISLSSAALPPRLLPGCWSLLMGLGIFAARPFLPRAIGWVALGYLTAGIALLAASPLGVSLNPWAMGLTFGAGQVAAGVVLYWNVERGNDGR